MEHSSRVTVHDVARHAGLSVASVSRALTGARRVKPETAKRVQAASAELGYQPDLVGRSLRRRETETIGLVVADITNPFFPALVQAVEAAIRQAGYGLLLVDAQNDVETERRAIALLLARQVDALLISPCHRVQSQAAVERAAGVVRVVQIDREAARLAHFVGVDQSRAIADVLTHLAENGRRHPAFIGSDTSVSTSWERQRAFIEHAPAGRKEAAKRVLAGDFSVDWGRTAAAQAFERWPETDAIVCASDLIALGALQEALRRGRRIPDDVAVTGFDDTLLASASVPALTSVNQPVADLGEHAMAIATGTHGVGDAVVHVRARASLVVRASSAR